MTNEDALKIAATRVLGALEPFKALSEHMPLHYITAFLYVARDEGHNVPWYADKAGISQPLMTRLIFDLGEKAHIEAGHKGFGLIERFDNPSDGCFQNIRLSPKGRGVASQMAKALDAGATPAKG